MGRAWWCVAMFASGCGSGVVLEQPSAPPEWPLKLERADANLPAVPLPVVPLPVADEPESWAVRPLDGVLFDAMAVSCDGKASAQMAVDSATTVVVGADCTAMVTRGGAEIDLSFPSGAPGAVRCGADGACARVAQ